MPGTRNQLDEVFLMFYSCMAHKADNCYFWISLHLIFGVFYSLLNGVKCVHYLRSFVNMKMFVNLYVLDGCQGRIKGGRVPFETQKWKKINLG